MALTPSTMMMAPGTEAPPFQLPDVVSGKTFSLDDVRSDGPFLLMFICRHCPYVKHVQDELARLGAEYAGKGMGIAAISSNDAAKHPDDAPPKLREFAEKTGLNFPLLYDESQEIAKAYSAACTPDFFLFAADCKLVYRGQLDDSRPENGKPVTGQDLRRALDAVLAGQPVDTNQKPSMGCNIKWKSGNEPAYYR